MAEWFKALVPKTSEPRGSVGFEILFLSAKNEFALSGDGVAPESARARPTVSLATKESRENNKGVLWKHI